MLLLLLLLLLSAPRDLQFLLVTSTAYQVRRWLPRQLQLLVQVDCCCCPPLLLLDLRRLPRPVRGVAAQDG
jgi:hypothetical protein